MKILCVCTGNTCRSPMLMALLRAEVERHNLSDVQVESAGTAAVDGEPASSYARTCMELRGLDLSAHQSQHVDDLDLTSYERVLCMTSGHAAALRSRGVPALKLSVINAESGGVPDPFGGSLDEYETCARVLDNSARAIVQGLHPPPRI